MITSTPHFPQIDKQELFVFSPLPPIRNGIADYTIRFIEGLSSKYSVTAFCNSAFAERKDTFEIVDEAFAFDHITDGSNIVYQVGNNHDHRFVLDAALRFPGIVLLHDPRLLYLYQVSERSLPMIRSLMKDSNPTFSKYLDLTGDFRGPTKLDHVLFDALPELLQASRKIVVHSSYARQLICWHHGNKVASKISVIPPFAYTAKPQSREAARVDLNLEGDAFIIVTAGFVHRRKRYEWLAEAVDALAANTDRKIIWIQAGAVDNEDNALSEILEQFPSVKNAVRVTGYISEATLDAYTKAADVLINLRFPSDGENSASLLRAFGAGVCCIVSDTASYSEIPDDVAIKIPIVGAPSVIAEALLQLSDNPAIRDEFGRRAALYAKDELSMLRYVERFSEIIERH